MLHLTRNTVGGTGIVLLLAATVSAVDDQPQSTTTISAEAFELEAMTLAMRHVGRLLEALEDDESASMWSRPTGTDAEKILARREGVYHGWKAMIMNVDAAIFVSVDRHGPHVGVGLGQRGGYPSRSHRDPDFRKGYNMWAELTKQINRSLEAEASGKQVALERLLRSGLSLHEAKEQTLVNYRAVLILRRLPALSVLPKLEEPEQKKVTVP